MNEAWIWGTENRITDGTNPEGIMTREQMMVMLYRTSWAGRNRRHLFNHGGHSFYA